MATKRIPVALVILLVLALPAGLVRAQGFGRGGRVDVESPSVVVDCDSTIEVSIDIRPQNEENCISCTSEKGLITVAILSDEEFDAPGVVDYTTVSFEGAAEIHVSRKSGEPRRHVEDVDGDLDMDLVFHFAVADTALECESTEATLVGATVEGQCIVGTSSVNMVAGGHGKP